MIMKTVNLMTTIMIKVKNDNNDNQYDNNDPSDDNNNNGIGKIEELLFKRKKTEGTGEDPFDGVERDSIPTKKIKIDPCHRGGKKHVIYYTSVKLAP